jgi:hypothetical protein
MILPELMFEMEQLTNTGESSISADATNPHVQNISDINQLFIFHDNNDY